MLIIEMVLRLLYNGAIFIVKNNSEGLEIIDDFLPKDVAQHLERLYVREQEWEHIDQVRESYYQHVFKNDSDYFPKEDEYYLNWIKFYSPALSH